MKIDIRNVKTYWLNVDGDDEKNKHMISLLEKLKFTNTERFSAITNIEKDPNARKGEEHYRSCAESHFAILQKAIENKEFPIIIFEDDVDVDMEVFSPEMTIPDDSHAIYLGTSLGNNLYSAYDIGEGLHKIQRVYATHAIMYLNEEFAKFVISTGRWWIYTKNRPFDLGYAYLVQPYSNVYTPHKPMFYQSAAFNEGNVYNVELLTTTPLDPLNHFKYPPQFSF